MSPAPRRFEVRATRESDGVTTLRFEGEIEELGVREFERLARHSDLESGAPVRVDLDGLSRLGGRGVVRLQHLARRWEAEGREFQIRANDPRVRRLLMSFDRTLPERLQPPHPRRGLRRFLNEAALFGHILMASSIAAMVQIVSLDHRRLTQTLRDVARMGVSAIPLIALLSFLIGGVLAFQSAPTLMRFGQERFIADIVGLSIVREIGPLITAILVAGRSGAALTAEIGTMKVSEEIDALRVMGLRPISVLVAPRLRTLALVLPVLSAIADLMGILGGLVVGRNVLGLSLQAYLDRTVEAVRLMDVSSGLIKSVLFAVVICTVSAWQGFSCPSGASGVGQATTRAVVLSIVGIILVDAVMTIVLFTTHI